MVVSSLVSTDQAISSEVLDEPARRPDHLARGSGGVMGSADNAVADAQQSY
jgi:hypothetical protein